MSMARMKTIVVRVPEALDEWLKNSKLSSMFRSRGELIRYAVVRLLRQGESSPAFAAISSGGKMVTISLKLPEQMVNWVQQQVKRGAAVSFGAYIRLLVLEDMLRRIGEGEEEG